MSSVVEVLKRALQVADERQKLLASNLANVDTPGYKRRDLDFRQMLDYISGNWQYLRTDSPRHFPVSGEGFPRIELDKTLSQRTDGNNVDFDKEMVEILRNSMWYRAIGEMLDRRFKTVKMVLTSMIR